MVLGMGLALIAGCKTYVPMNKDFPGGVKNPIRTNGVETQRAYLRRLRMSRENREAVHYEYITSVRGPDGTVLDVFELDHYDFKNCELGPLERLRDRLREAPLCPTRLRIYMNMYGTSPSSEQTVYGYWLIPLAEKNALSDDPSNRPTEKLQKGP